MAGDAMKTQEDLREFFRSDGPHDFIDTYCVGEFPWAVVLDNQGRLVMADCDRSRFFLVVAMPEGFESRVIDDPIHLIDPEYEDATVIGTHEFPDEAFAAIASEAGLDLPAPVR